VLASRLSGATRIENSLSGPPRAKIIQLSLLSESALTLVDAIRWGWSSYKSQKWSPSVWCCRHTYMYDSVQERLASWS